MPAEQVDMADFDQPILDKLADLVGDCVRSTDEIEQFMADEGLTLDAVRKTAEGYGYTAAALADDKNTAQLTATAFFCGFELALRFKKDQRS